MSAYLTAVAWVVETLRGDPAVSEVVGDRVFEGIAPQHASYPMVTVQTYTDAVDINYTGRRAFTNVTLLVSVWDSAPGLDGSTFTRIAPVATRVDELLTLDAPVDRGTGVIHACARYAEFNGTDQRQGSLVRHLGGRWQIAVS